VGDRSGVRIWDLETGDFRGSLPDIDVRSIRFIENGGSDLVTLGDELRVWRLAGGPVSRFAVGDGVTSIALAPDGRTLAVTRGKGLTVTTLDGIRLFDGSWHDTVVKGGAFTDDGSAYVATAGQSKRLARFETSDWSMFEQAFEIEFAVREATVISPPNMPRYWIAASHSCGAKAFFEDHADATDLLAPYGCPPVNDITRSPGGRFLAIYDAVEGAIYLLDTHHAQVPAKLAHNRDATNVYLADDGRTMIAAEMDALTEWDLTDTSVLIRVFPSRGTAFISTSMSPDGRFVAGGARDGSTWLWERPTQRLRAVFRDHDQRTSAVSFLSNEVLATGSWDWTVRLRSLAVLDRPTKEWIPLVEQRWGLALDDVLDGGFQ
jgi:WD40 repeat protein